MNWGAIAAKAAREGELMSNGSTSRPATRDWRVIAKEAVEEKDPKKMLELCLELDRALELQKPQDGTADYKRNAT